MSGINPTIKSVSKTPTLNTALPTGQQVAIAASASALGVNRGILDLAATGASLLAEKLSYGTPGFSIANLDQLLKAQGHQAGGKKAEPQSSSEKSDVGYRNAYGEHLNENHIKAIEANAANPTAEAEKAKIKQDIDSKIANGDLISAGGELFQKNTVKLYDTQQLQLNLANGSKFTKNTDGSFKFDGKFNILKDDFNKLLKGEAIKVKDSTGKEQVLKYTNEKLTLDGKDIEGHGLDKITYGDSGLNGDGHKIAGAALGFLNNDSDKIKRAKEFDSLLAVAKGALPSELKDKVDAHTLSLLTGKFAKNIDGKISVDGEALKVALTDKVKKQITDDQAIRKNHTLKEIKDNDEHKTAQTTNLKSYTETVARFNFDQANADTALKALGFETGDGTKGLTQFAGSAYAASAELSSRLNKGADGAKSALATQLSSALSTASKENPIKLNLSILMAAKANTDAKGAYDDCTRGADGALGTLMALEGGIKPGQVHDLQLLAQGEEGLKKAQDQMLGLLQDQDIQKAIKDGSIQVTGLDINMFGHANQDGMLLDKETKNVDHKGLTADDTNDISAKTAEIANAGKIDTVRLSVIGCNVNEVATALGKAIHNETNGEDKAKSEVIVDSTKEYAKLSGNNLTSNDEVRQFSIDHKGNISGHDRWSNDGSSTTGGKSCNTERTIIESSDSNARANEASSKKVSSQVDGYRKHQGDAQTNQSASGASGGAGVPDPKKRDGAGSIEDGEFLASKTSPADETWKKQGAAS
jgi:hypothetical protein